jgi:glycosyltransferase involved in cell wall biosynthesis
VASCRVSARSPHGTFVWPRRLPSDDEDLSEYLFVRRGPFSGEAFVSTSTLLASRSLFLDEPFDEQLRRHQEWDWLLRVVRRRGAKVVMVDGPLVVQRIDQTGATISSEADWADSAAWIEERKDLVTRRAYAGFLCTHIAASAARARAYRAIPTLVGRLVRRGSPGPWDLALLIAFWIVPVRSWRRLRSRFGGSASPTGEGPVVQIVTQREAGGAQRVALLLARELRGRGVAGHVVFLYRKRDAFEGEPGWSDLAPVRPKVHQLPSLLVGLVRVLRHPRPSAVILHTHYANVIGAPLAQLLRVPIRVAVHHAPLTEYNRIVRHIDRFVGTIGCYTDIVCVGQAVLDTTASCPAPYRRRCVVIPNAVAPPPPSTAPGDVRDRYGIPPRVPLLLNVGRLDAQKAQATLLRALRSVPDAYLVIVGEGPARANLEREAEALGVADRVVLTGEVAPDAVSDLRSTATMFVFPSVWEAMPLALLEAIADDLPVLASDIAAHRDVLGESDLLAVDDADAWADAIRLAIADPGKLESLRAIARTAARRFSLEAFVSGYERVLAR